jgi:hypothetical protein
MFLQKEKDVFLKFFHKNSQRCFCIAPKKNSEKFFRRISPVPPFPKIVPNKKILSS